MLCPRYQLYKKQLQLSFLKRFPWDEDLHEACPQYLTAEQRQQQEQAQQQQATQQQTLPEQPPQQVNMGGVCCFRYCVLGVRMLFQTLCVSLSACTSILCIDRKCPTTSCLHV